MFYLITVIVSAMLIATSEFLTCGVYMLSSFGEALLHTAISVVAVFIVDAVAALVTRRLPSRWFLPEAKLFFVGKREKNFYRKTKINTWKKYIPEWGCFTGFHKDKMLSPEDSEYVGRFLLESNYGVAGHVAGALLGFLIMAIPSIPSFTVALPVAVVNMILSILPTMVLRFNTPALRRLYRRSLEREEKEAGHK